MKGKILGLLTVGLMTCSAASQGAAVFSFQEVGGNVVLTLSGSLNTTGLSVTPGYDHAPPLVDSGFAVIGTGTAHDVVDFYGTILTGPQSFGTGPAVNPTTSTGDSVYLDGFNRNLWLPSGYQSGSALMAAMTFVGQSFSSLGLLRGDYLYTLRTQDTLSVRVGNSVPEPGTLALLGLGLAGLGVSRRRKGT